MFDQKLFDLLAFGMHGDVLSKSTKTMVWLDIESCTNRVIEHRLTKMAVCLICKGNRHTWMKKIKKKRGMCEDYLGSFWSTKVTVMRGYGIWHGLPQSAVLFSEQKELIAKIPHK